MNEIVEKIKNSEKIDLSLTLEAVKVCNDFYRDSQTKKEACDIVIYALNNIDKISPESIPIWTDLIESIGFYPYLSKYSTRLAQLSLSEKIRQEHFKSYNIENIFLHDEQKYCLDKILNNTNMIISAPTSFGKSLLIEEVISSNKFNNILIIQPTLALLDETRRKLTKYNNYTFILRTTQECSKKNIFLLTAERVVERKNFESVDLLIIDEFYKLSENRDDERADILNIAFSQIYKAFKPQFLLLGPNIEKVSDGFCEKYNAEFFKTKYSLVANEMDNTNIKSYKTTAEKEKVLFDLLLNLKDEQSIIYCSSPFKAQELANKFVGFLSSFNNTELETNSSLPLIEWITNNISREWFMTDCLHYKIGVHDGSLPKHITSSIIKYFNECKINYLFCTSTIIEGVNTSAKNIIFYDKTKGNNKKIDYFDYCNIRGRAGRLMHHLVGKIYNFNTVPEEEITDVNIPFFQQNPISDELLITLDEEDIKYPNTPQAISIKQIDSDTKKLLKDNAVSVKGQQNILRIMTELNLNNFIWNGYPTYEELKLVLGLAWDNFNNQSSTMTKNKLPVVVNKYCRNKSILNLIKDTYQYKKSKGYERKKAINASIQEVFQIQKHWFEYKVPKWLNVMDSLQRFVANKLGISPGDYSFIANKIENGFTNENVSILFEYNLPGTLINKLQSYIPETIPENDVISYIKTQNIIEKALLTQYEKDLIKDNLLI